MTDLFIFPSDMYKAKNNKSLFLGFQNLKDDVTPERVSVLALVIVTSDMFPGPGAGSAL